MDFKTILILLIIGDFLVSIWQSLTSQTGRGEARPPSMTSCTDALTDRGLDQTSAAGGTPLVHQPAINAAYDTAAERKAIGL